MVGIAIDGNIAYVANYYAGFSIIKLWE
jgi:hypothetical protein